VQLKLRIPEGTQRNFSGTILACAEGRVRIGTTEGEREFAFENIDKARLVPKF
jgi:ribosome maturation factor RimP